MRAAHEIGLADLTVKAVAAHLGVSVGALYHHIDNKDDLLRLAAEYSVTRTRVPDDHGQHWALWLCEWAAYNRDVFAAEPTLLDHYLDGTISPEVIARRTESILTVLVRQGFTVPDALAAYELVAAYGMGAALHAIRANAPHGRDSVTQLRELLQRDPSPAPTSTRSCARSPTTRPTTPSARSGPASSRSSPASPPAAARTGTPWPTCSAATDAAHPAPSAPSGRRDRQATRASGWRTASNTIVPLSTWAWPSGRTDRRSERAAALSGCTSARTMSAASP